MAISILALAAAAYSPNFAAPQLAPTAAAAHLAALRPHPVACAPSDDERDETAQFLQILGGLSLGCVGVFSGASALGADDVVAGNLVLVALAAVGAYLFYFDGGVTQAALASQAVQEVASGEGELVAQAPREEAESRAGRPAAAVAADPAAAADALRADGVVRIDGALSAAAADALAAHVDAELAAARSEKPSLDADGRFGPVLSRTNRWDLKLRRGPAVDGALAEVLASGGVAKLLDHALGDEPGGGEKKGATLFELAALVSDPGSPRQPIHPDTPRRPGSEAPAVVTAFVALQDVDEEMGPTLFLPRTQSADAHEKFNAPEDGGRAKAELLRTTPHRLGLLKKGDVALFDARLLHGGLDNRSARRRRLFYFSFKDDNAAVRPSESIMDEVRRRYSLDDCAAWG